MLTDFDLISFNKPDVRKALKIIIVIDNQLSISYVLFLINAMQNTKHIVSKHLKKHFHTEFLTQF